MDTVAGQGEYVALLGSQGSFTLSLVVGMAVIAFYARKRMEELINPPKGEEYDFTKLLPIDVIVGSSNFYKSYILYVLMLEFLYFFLCSAKPLVLLLINDPEGATFQGAAWPLGAALLVVGLLPSTPAVAQVETMLRSLAQRIANIPEEFFGRVSQLTRSDLERMFSRAPQYRGKTRKYEKIRNLLLCLGFAPDEATRIARSCISAELFAGWTIYGKDVWSAGEYENYSNIISSLKPKSELLRKQTDDLLARTQDLAFVTEMKASYQISDLTLPLALDMRDTLSEDAALRRGRATIDVDAPVQKIVEEWAAICSDSEIAAKRLSALFAIMARNDREATRRYEAAAIPVSLQDRDQPGGPVAAGLDHDAIHLRADFGKSDAVISELLGLMETRVETEPWSEAAFLAAVIGFFFCTIGLACYFYLADWARFYAGWCSPGLSDGIRRLANGIAWLVSLGNSAQFETCVAANAQPVFSDAMKNGLRNAFTLAVSFTLASLVALFLRSLKIEDKKWKPFEDFKTVPAANYIDIVMWCSMGAFMPLVISTVSFYYDPRTGFDELTKVPPERILYLLFSTYLSGLASVAYAVSLCWIADLVDDEATSPKLRRHVWKFSAFAGVTIAFTLLATNYTLMQSVFWSTVVSILLLSFTAMSAFHVFYRSRKFPRSARTKTQPDLPDLMTAPEVTLIEHGGAAPIEGQSRGNAPVAGKFTEKPMSTAAE